MEISPNDILNKEFRRILRGYDPDQVAEFLQRISDHIFRLLEERQRLQSQINELQARLQQFVETEDLMHNALLLAERTAEETRQQARHEADLIRREALQQVESERAAQDALFSSRRRLVSEMRAMLQAQLAMLEHADDRRAPHENDTDT